MNPIERDELSAYLDGELATQRRQEIQGALANSAALREELQRLTSADSQWRAAARSAVFEPQVRLRTQTSVGFSLGRALLCVLLLLAIRALPKLANTVALALGLNALALALALTAVSYWILSRPPRYGCNTAGTVTEPSSF